MRHSTRLVCLALMLAAGTARADILPERDRGPPMGGAGGLDFAIQAVNVRMHGYSKTEQRVVLVGCTDGQPNCTLARSRHLIGMEVSTVNDRPLQPRFGMVQEILDAFAPTADSQTVTLEFYSSGSNNEAIKVSFARH